jgi:hypothetical protein
LGLAFLEFSRHFRRRCHAETAGPTLEHVENVRSLTVEAVSERKISEIEFASYAASALCAELPLRAFLAEDDHLAQVGKSLAGTAWRAVAGGGHALRGAHPAPRIVRVLAIPRK